MKICLMLLILLICLCGIGEFLVRIHLQLKSNYYFTVQSAKVRRMMDYKISGQVEIVSYLSSTFWPCSISMSNGDSNGNRKYYYHASKYLSLCEFAERCKNLNKDVNVYAVVEDDANVIDRIEFANTNSKWWQLGNVVHNLHRASASGILFLLNSNSVNSVNGPNRSLVLFLIPIDRGGSTTLSFNAFTRTPYPLILGEKTTKYL